MRIKSDASAAPSRTARAGARPGARPATAGAASPPLPGGGSLPTAVHRPAGAQRMKIVVCVKHVPDLQADRRFTDDGRVDREGVDDTLNELDENAVEAALRLVEAAGGEVIAL